MYIYPHIGIVHAERGSDGQSTRPYDSNILTRKPAGTNDAPREPLHGSIIENSTNRIKIC